MALSNGLDKEKIEQLEKRNAELCTILLKFLFLEKYDRDDLIKEAEELLDKELGIK